MTDWMRTSCPIEAAEAEYNGGPSDELLDEAFEQVMQDFCDELSVDYPEAYEVLETHHHLMDAAYQYAENNSDKVGERLNELIERRQYGDDDDEY